MFNIFLKPLSRKKRNSSAQKAASRLRFSPTIKSLVFSAFGLANVSLASLSHAEETSKTDTYSLPGIPYAATTLHTPSAPTITENSFSLLAKKGTDLYTTPAGEAKADNVPRLLFQVKGDFILSAKVSSEFNADYDGGGLLVYGGNNQWAKLLIEQVPNNVLVVSSSVVNHKGDGAYHATTQQKDIYLKLVRYKNKYFFYSSQNGQDWQILRDFSLDAIETTQVGFYSQAPLGEKVTTRFSDISFNEVTITKYWQGQ